MFQFEGPILYLQATKYDSLDTYIDILEKGQWRLDTRDGSLLARAAPIIQYTQQKFSTPTTHLQVFLPCHSTLAIITISVSGIEIDYVREQAKGNLSLARKIGIAVVESFRDSTENHANLTIFPPLSSRSFKYISSCFSFNRISYWEIVKLAESK